MDLGGDVEPFGLAGALEVVDLAAVLVADPGVGDLVAEPGAGPVCGDELPVPRRQVQVGVLVVAVLVADELARVDQAPATAGGAASEPVGDDGVLVRAAEVDRLEVEHEPGGRVDDQGPHGAVPSWQGGS